MDSSEFDRGRPRWIELKRVVVVCIYFGFIFFAGLWRQVSGGVTHGINVAEGRGQRRRRDASSRRVRRFYDFIFFPFFTVSRPTTAGVDSWPPHVAMKTLGASAAAHPGRRVFFIPSCTNLKYGSRACE